MRRGFTLVEMLVATALVMLIMLLFARIFEEAISTVRAQRSIIANDEKARAVSQMLRSDLNRATYRASVGRGASTGNPLGIIESPRGIVPLVPGDRVDPHQRGFIYYSENDPNDAGDDVLHLTVSIGETLQDPLASNPDYAPYQGRANFLAEDFNRNGVLDAGEDLNGNTLLDFYPNQPDADDGRANGASVSRAADACYFLRGTTLYRRVQLMRDPLPSAAPPYSTQPTIDVTGTGGPLLSTYTNFYRDFDFASTSLNGQLHFHGLESLDNSLGLANNPLAAPGFRFGFAPNGTPREFDVNGVYFGRFTQGETSHETANGLGTNGFRWPGLDDGANNRIVDSPLVMSPAGVIAPDSNANGSFDAGTDVPLQGSRLGEDILMTGVETFDIQFWDSGYQEVDVDGGGWQALNPADDRNLNGVQDSGTWVDLGNSTGWGMYALTPSGPPSLYNASWGRQNAAYGPGGPAGNNVFDTWHPSLGALAPYRPLQVGPGDPRFTIMFPWTSNTAVAAGTVFFPDGAIPNLSIGYVALSSGNTGARVPEWSREPGSIVRDNGVIWQCFDNRLGLEKIRITIRFRDPGTAQPRQVTVVHSFVE